ncbi:MAG: DNA-3-methyladenine glycosylase [Calditrichaeota bacterium]|nr:DNA-3-methyladenine glycosylase [Calditrichota bacterium]
MKLEQDFYQREDVERIARELLGKILFTNFDEKITSGIIVETEAYAGITDRASHAWNGRRTKRTEIMYRTGGTAYVYLIYGIHSLFNVVTNREDIPHAVLVRAIEPIDGIQIMLQRRNLTKKQKNISGGPGLLSQALGIKTQHSGLSLLDGSIWIEDRNINISEKKIASGPRIGVDYAGDGALLPRRYWIKDNPWVSR